MKPNSGPEILDELYAVILHRQAEMPEGSYVASLMEGGWRKIGQKVIEEAGETVIAGSESDRERISEEAADLIFHLLVFLADAGVDPEMVWAELAKRRR